MIPARTSEFVSTIRPRSSTITRLHSRSTAFMLWLTEQHGAPLPRDVVHLAQALLLELGVADREHLVDTRISGSRCAATAKASRTYMPLE